MEEENRIFDLQKFVERLVREKEGSNLHEEAISQKVADLLRRVEDRIYMLILQLMPEESLGEFENLLDSDEAEEKIQDFCVTHIKGFDELVAQELLDFRQAYLKTTVV